MRHTLKLHGIIVGHSDLEQIEPGTGRASGTFRPGLGYELVQPIFRLYAHAVSRDGSVDQEKLARYYKASDALALELQDANGAPIRTSAIHIADFTVEGDGIELDVLIPDHSYWERRSGKSQSV